MYSAQIANANGELLELTGHETQYQVMSIRGLNPPNAQINLSTVVGMDGANFNSSKLETRNIVIMLRLNGDVESNRLLLYSIVQTKELCTFYYQNDSRDVYIEGYVDSVECDYFNMSEVMQISIICPQPYFKALDEIIDDISKVIPQFTFPFSINIGEPVVISSLDAQRVTNVQNVSASQTGVIVEITFEDSASEVKIQNTETGEFIELEYSFLAGDVVTINTNKGQKKISLVRDGGTSNIFPALQSGSTFFQLNTGDNFFSYAVDNGDNDSAVNILFKHYSIYRGV